MYSLLFNANLCSSLYFENYFERQIIYLILFFINVSILILFSNLFIYLYFLFLILLEPFYFIFDIQVLELIKNFLETYHNINLIRDQNLIYLLLFLFILNI